MRIGWIYDDQFLAHDTGPHHPERPDRLRAITAAFEQTGLDRELISLTPQPIDPTKLHRIHDAAYVQHVAAACAAGQTTLDAGDTVICPASYDIARLATGGAIMAADAVMDGELDRVFCTMRPPGHHAERDRAMGFCLFNHIAIAADHLVHERGLQRVAIVDFDVHHGNGTQHAFERRRDVMFISIHQDPRTLYPGTGYADEHGEGRGEGYTLNLPMPPGAGDGEYQAAFDLKIIPALRDFDPETLLISAGFDAAAGDPLASIQLTPNGFTWMTRRLCELADQHCGGRVISLLEGGYNLDNLAACAVAHVRALMEKHG